MLGTYENVQAARSGSYTASGYVAAQTPPPPRVPDRQSVLREYLERGFYRRGKRQRLSEAEIATAQIGGKLIVHCGRKTRGPKIEGP
jgi:hypothetical protein